MKRLLWFTAGVIAGVIAVLYYEIFGKPTLPKVEKHNVTFGFDYERLARAILNTPIKSVQVVNFDALMPEYDGWADVFEDEPDEYLDVPDKTQPIKVED